FTALALLERDDAERPPTYRVRSLHRFPLGTPYTHIPRTVAQRLTNESLDRSTHIAIDATGVGAPMIDLFKQELPNTALSAITTTGGTNVTGRPGAPHVPKPTLITTAILLLEQCRIRIAADLEHRQALVDELVAFRRTTNENGYDTYSAPPGEHDDLI